MWTGHASALSRYHPTSAQRDRARRQRVVAVLGRPILRLRGKLGRGISGADLRLRHQPRIGGRSHRHYPDPGQRALCPGARRPQHRHQFRRHRCQPRDDDRNRRRARDVDADLFLGAGRRNNAATGHRLVRSFAGFGFAHFADAGIRRVRHSGRCRERAHPGSTIRHPISN